MVPKKRLDYGFNGRRSPVIPKAPRSNRRRCSRKNTDDDNRLCAFELLAAVAGKLLQESESSVSSNVEAHRDENAKGQPTVDKTPKSDSTDHGSSAESSFMPETSAMEIDLSSMDKGLPQKDNNSVQKKLDFDSKLGSDQVDAVDGQHEMHLGDDTKTPNAEECVNSNMVIKSDDSVQLPPLYRDPIPHNVKLGIRDDDDNSFRCKSSTKVKPFRPQYRSYNRRIRKMLTSKYRKMAPKLRGCEFYNSRDGVKSFYGYRKRIYTQERCLQPPIKKMKIDHRNAVACDRDTSSHSISSSLDKSSSAIMLEKVSGASPTANAHKKSKDSHVKFSIKSFKVPELYIEVPETASVGSMKRTVMEAVNAILGSGIRVGVVLHGKKIRDDNRTLQQAGISHNSNLDSLGFTLEPSFKNLSPSTTTKKRPLMLPSEADQELLRSPGTPAIDSGISNASLVHPPLESKVDNDGNTSDFISSPHTPTNEIEHGCKALVPVPPSYSDSLAVVPLNSKQKRNELSQRRTRRPFSVAEVEALVAAVEKLGTGRWRDVKVGAFENADHRTYVDLKDKWKTLVHTAGISPHQRRGEPVPQELLDRVLAAHSYWSMHQSKQHVAKKQAEPIESVQANEAVVGA